MIAAARTTIRDPIGRISWLQNASFLAIWSTLLAAMVAARNLIYPDETGLVTTLLATAGIVFTFHVRRTGATDSVTPGFRRAANSAIVLLTALAVWSYLVRSGVAFGWLDLGGFDVMRLGVYDAVRILLAGILWMTAFRSFTLFTQRDLLLTLLPGLSIILLVCVLEPTGSALPYVVWYSVSAWLVITIDQRLRLLESHWATPAHRPTADPLVPEARTSLLSLLAVLLLAFVMSTILSRWIPPSDRLQQSGTRLAWYLARFMVDPNRTMFGGFSEGVLGVADPAPAIGTREVFSVRSSRGGYWRGRTYDDFDRSFWRPSAQTQSVVLPRVDGWLHGGKLPHVRPGSPKRALDRVEQRFQMKSIQMGTVHGLSLIESIRAPLPRVRIDAHGSVTCARTFVPGDQYTVVSVVFRDQPDSVVSGVLDDRAREICREIPVTTTDRTRKLAARIVRGARTDRERAIQLRGYLRDRYTYSLAIWPFPKDQDAVDYFLFEARAGYCVHFASALAVLARCAGMPARVVSGYLPGEQDPQTGEYTVRESDAHAWTEVFLRDFGWTIFDASPASEGDGQSLLTRIGQWAQRLLESTGSGLTRLSRSLWQPVTLMGLVVAGLGIALAMTASRRHHRDRGGRAPQPADFQVPAALLEIGHEFCRKLSRRFRARNGAETLHEFGILAAADSPQLKILVQDFVMRYHEARYGPRGPTEDEIEVLREYMRRPEMNPRSSAHCRDDALPVRSFIKKPRG